ncbi:MAG: hypothetical protein WA948_11150 [Pontixanthobacter sp.]
MSGSPVHLLMSFVMTVANADYVAEAAVDDPVERIRPIDFVPWGWKLFDKSDGDLNGDGRTDTAIVIQKNDPRAVISNPSGSSVFRYDANPRVLLVVLQDHGGRYRRVAFSERIIPDHDSSSIGDPYGEMRIEAEALHLDLRFFANRGSWESSNREFQFRWDGEAMALIGFDIRNIRRNTGELRATSIDYRTGRRKHAQGSIQDDELQWRWTELPRVTPPTLNAIGDGFAFVG